MAEDTAAKQPRRGIGRQFGKGQSGNPSGRPAGSRNRATLAVEQLLEGEAKALARACVTRALAGDGIALRLAMDRIAPVRRGRPVTFDLPAIDGAADLTKALGSILRAAAAGVLTPEEAATIAGVLEVKRKALETTDLEMRLGQLEERLSAGGQR